MTTGLSERRIRQLMAEKLGKRKVDRSAVVAFKQSLEQTSSFVLDRAAQAHDHENVVRRQIGERPRVRLSAKHIRIALGADSDQGPSGHA